MILTGNVKQFYSTIEIFQVVVQPRKQRFHIMLLVRALSVHLL